MRTTSPAQLDSIPFLLHSSFKELSLRTTHQVSSPLPRQPFEILWISQATPAPRLLRSPQRSL